MSELVSMKISAAGRKQLAEPSMIGEKDGPRYPYGLSIELDDEALDKLGVKTLPKVGSVQTLVARVEVTSVSSNQGPDKQKRERVSLQITDCCLEPEAAAAKVEEALYGKSKG